MTTLDDQLALDLWPTPTPKQTRRTRRPRGWRWTLGAILENATDPLPGTGCRLWAGSVNSDGYGNVGLDGRTVNAHRLVMCWSYGYELDEVPSRVVTRHRCGNRRCVEPDHLLAGWAIHNVQDAVRDGSMPWAFADGRCHRGHDVSDPANMRVRSNGERACRACSAEWQRQYDARRRAERSTTVTDDDSGTSATRQAKAGK